jgi:hypothetical protein
MNYLMMSLAASAEKCKTKDGLSCTSSLIFVYLMVDVGLMKRSPTYKAHQPAKFRRLGCSPTLHAKISKHLRLFDGGCWADEA